MHRRAGHDRGDCRPARCCRSSAVCATSVSATLTNLAFVFRLILEECGGHVRAAGEGHWKSELSRPFSFRHQWRARINTSANVWVCQSQPVWVPDWRQVCLASSEFRKHSDSANLASNEAEAPTPGTSAILDGNPPGGRTGHSAACGRVGCDGADSGLRRGMKAERLAFSPEVSASAPLLEAFQVPSTRVRSLCGAGRQGARMQQIADCNSELRQP